MSEEKKEQEVTEEQPKKPLMFLVSLGDCEPVIYTIMIALNQKYGDIVVKEDTFKRLVEETNEVLQPVFEKFNKELANE